MSDRSPNYFVIKGASNDMMLLYDLPDPNATDGWLSGRRFERPPTGAVECWIVDGSEQATPLPFYSFPPLMRNDVLEALTAAGVDNLDVYDAVIKSETGVEISGYKAYNLLGLVRAAGPSTKFNPDNESRLIDASIDELEVAPERARGLLMFRMAESVGVILVHERIKAALEKHAFHGMEFYEPSQAVVL